MIIPIIPIPNNTDPGMYGAIFTKATAPAPTKIKNGNLIKRQRTTNRLPLTISPAKMTLQKFQ